MTQEVCGDVLLTKGPAIAHGIVSDGDLDRGLSFTLHEHEFEKGAITSLTLPKLATEPGVRRAATARRIDGTDIQNPREAPPPWIDRHRPW